MTTTPAIESKATPETSKAPKQAGLSGTVLELGFAWAAYGLKLGTAALVESAKTLELTAKALDRLSTEFAQKSRVKAEPPEAAK